MYLNIKTQKKVKTQETGNMTYTTLSIRKMDVTCDKGRIFIMNQPIPQEGTMTQNMNVPNNRTSKDIKQNPTVLKGEMDKSHYNWNFRNPSPVTNRT